MAQAAGTQLPPKRRGKSDAAFRTISEVAADLDVPQHVLRFWETKFVQIKPMKRGGGRRYYRPEDVDLLRRIRSLLYNDGYTIKGVQKLLKQNANAAGLPVDDAGIAADPPADVEPPEAVAQAAPGLSEGQRGELTALLEELQELSQLLRRTDR